MDRANLRRAIRSLVRMDRVYEHAEDDVIDPYIEEWGIRWGALVEPEPVSDEDLYDFLRLLWEQYE